MFRSTGPATSPGGVRRGTIKLFYRVVTTPEHVHDDLPLLIFLQGGPGRCRPAFEQPDLRWLD